jgi:hypothetical protein
MFNFFKPRIHTSQLAIECTNASLSILKQLDVNEFEVWLEMKTFNNMRNIVTPEILEVAFDAQFNSDNFLNSYKRLSSNDKDVVINGICEASRIMFSYLKAECQFSSHMTEMAKSYPKGARINWRFPKITDHPDSLAILTNYLNENF